MSKLIRLFESNCLGGPDLDASAALAATENQTTTSRKTQETKNMKKLILRILVQSALMAIMLLVAIGTAVLAHQTPQPLAIILTFLSWVAVGIGWQELSRWISRRWGL